MTLTPPSSPLGQGPAKPASTPLPVSGNRQEVTPPKCFGTDYYGKWNSTGMTWEAMKIDRPDYQSKCANCNLFERCYMLNQIRLMRIKK